MACKISEHLKISFRELARTLAFSAQPSVSSACFPISRGKAPSSFPTCLVPKGSVPFEWPSSCPGAPFFTRPVFENILFSQTPIPFHLHSINTPISIVGLISNSWQQFTVRYKWLMVDCLNRPGNIFILNLDSRWLRGYRLWMSGCTA